MKIGKYDVAGKAAIMGILNVTPRFIFRWRTIRNNRSGSENRLKPCWRQGGYH